MPYQPSVLAEPEKYPPIDQQQPLLWIRELRSCHQKLDRRRKTVLRLRQKLIDAQQGQIDKVRFIRESHQVLLDKILAMDHVPDKKLGETVIELHHLAETDLEEFEKQASSTQHLAARLNGLEYDMQREEGRLQEISEKICLHVGGWGVAVAGTSAEVVSLQPSQSSLSLSSEAMSAKVQSETTHPTLVTYYDKAGDVNVMQDRLHEVENEQLAFREKRQFAAEQEHSSVMEDETFESWCAVERQRAEDALGIAIAAREEALENCRAEGLDLYLRVPQLNIIEPIDADLQMKDGDYHQAQMPVQDTRNSAYGTHFGTSYTSLLSPRRHSKAGRLRQAHYKHQDVASWVSQTQDERVLGRQLQRRRSSSGGGIDTMRLEVKYSTGMFDRRRSDGALYSKDYDHRPLSWLSPTSFRTDYFDRGIAIPQV